VCYVVDVSVGIVTRRHTCKIMRVFFSFLCRFECSIAVHIQSKPQELGFKEVWHHREFVYRSVLEPKWWCNSNYILNTFDTFFNTYGLTECRAPSGNFDHFLNKSYVILKTLHCQNFEYICGDFSINHHTDKFNINLLDCVL
jgi:hypothetical protein